MKILNHFYCLFVTAVLAASLIATSMVYVGLEQGFGIQPMLDVMASERLAERVTQEAYGKFAEETKYFADLNDWVPTDITATALGEVATNTLLYVGGEAEQMRPVDLRPFEDVIVDKVEDQLLQRAEIRDMAKKALEAMGQGITDLSALGVDDETASRLVKQYEQVKQLPEDEQVDALIIGMVWPEGAPDLLADDLDVYGVAGRVFTVNPFDFARRGYGLVDGIAKGFLPFTTIGIALLIVLASRTWQAAFRWLGLAMAGAGAFLLYLRLEMAKDIPVTGEIPLWLHEIISMGYSDVMDVLMVLGLIAIAAAVAGWLLSLSVSAKPGKMKWIWGRFVVSVLILIAIGMYMSVVTAEAIAVQNQGDVLFNEVESKIDVFAEEIIREAGVLDTLENMNPLR